MSVCALIKTSSPWPVPILKRLLKRFKMDQVKQGTMFFTLDWPPPLAKTDLCLLLRLRFLHTGPQMLLAFGYDWFMPPTAAQVLAPWAADVFGIFRMQCFAKTGMICSVALIVFLEAMHV